MKFINKCKNAGSTISDRKIDFTQHFRPFCSPFLTEHYHILFISNTTQLYGNRFQQNVNK